MLAKMMIKFALALLLVPFAVQAQAQYVDVEQDLTDEQLRVTGLDTLSPAQLQALNRVLREKADKVAATAAQRPEREAPPRHGSYIGLDDQPIVSHLSGSISEWGPGTVFELANGQQWKVLKGSMKLRKVLQSPAVVVVPGVAGRWFMQVEQDLPKPRVYRID